MANVKDGATGTVLTAPSPATSGTSLVLNSTEGTRFPAVPFYAIAHPNNTTPTVSTSEKILVTGVSTDTLTIVRAQGIYSAKSIAVDWRISNAIFQEDMNNASIVKNETPGGSINGSNTAFTTASPAATVTGSLDVYKNGVRMKPGGADYTQTSTGFTMVTAPATGTVLLVDYIISGAINNVGTNSLITDEAVTGSVNGSNTVFTTVRAYIAGSLEVSINGLKQYRTTDFTETTPASGIFTMGVAPATGDVVRVAYQFNLNPASNSDTVDGIHANTTATANQLVPLDANGKFSAALFTNPYKFSAYASGTTSLAAAGSTKVAFAAEEFDTNNNFASSTYTVPVTGFYKFSASIQLTSGGTNEEYAVILYKNGAAVKYGNYTRTGGAGVQGLVVDPPPLSLAAGDTIEVYGLNGTGGGKTVSSGQVVTYFGGHLVSIT